MSRRLFFLFGLLIISFGLLAQESKKPISFTGGMFLQSGYYWQQDTQVNGLSNGLGGVLKFHITEHFYIGSSGGNIRRNYSTPESEFPYIDIGYGGLLGGWYHKSEKYRISLQGFAGMGKMTQLHIPSQIGNQLIGASYQENTIWILAPAIGFEYFLSEKISFLLQTELISAFHAKNHEFFLPLVRFGILFNR
ncbi:MAG: hypothetical protein PF448_13930 [Bacteroidales bacterium]|jgi:hypothetical protein|nr:hypothetical protein [Bacteroidales bacterium]